MARETLKDFFSTIIGDTSATTITYTNYTQAEIESDNPVNIQDFQDLGVETNTKRPLLDLDNLDLIGGEERSGILGDYLSFIIENSSNIFKIGPGNERAATHNRGDSLVDAESTGNAGADNVFVDQGDDQTLYNNLSQYSNSQYFENSNTPLDSIIDKTGGDGDSHSLLKGIDHEAEIGEDKVLDAVENLVLQVNRFSGATNRPSVKSFTTTNASDLKSSYSTTAADDFERGQGEIKGTMTSQNEYGIYDKNVNNGRKVTLNQLKDVGKSLLKRSTGHDLGSIPGDPQVDDESITGGFPNAFTSHYNEDSGTFTKTTFESIRAKNAAGAPTLDDNFSSRSGKGSFVFDEDDASSAKTFGSVYNHAMMFNGPERKMHKLTAALACKALVKALTDNLSEIVEMCKIQDLDTIETVTESYVSKNQAYQGPGPYLKGVHNKLVSFELDLFQKLVLVRTTYPYGFCFEKGVEIFFGSEFNSVEDISKSTHIKQAPGYWLSVASSILKSVQDFSNSISNIESFESESAEKISELMRLSASSKLIQFANVAATVGDIFFKTTNGRNDELAMERPRRKFDVDAMPTTPATRVGKSRDINGMTALDLAWRQNSVPSMYILPRSQIRSMIMLNNIADGNSPARAMLGSTLVENTYLDRTHDKSFNRIPNDVVKRLEDRLDAEYVPFYIRDMRTNEIISFHAFLTSLTDNITPSYTPVTGYGRMDPVQIYNTTTRSLNVGFTLYATNKEDFNTMWFKINKLVTLLYPQWTQGTVLSTDANQNNTFVQPFSQVLGASPVVRLRVGDVIKSNYSRFNLSRLFGIGDQGISPVVQEKSMLGPAVSKFMTETKATLASKKLSIQDLLVEIFYGVMGTPLQYFKPGESRMQNLALGAARNFVSNLLINGFVNPLGAGLITGLLRDPNKPNSISNASGIDLSSLGSEIQSIVEGDTVGYRRLQRLLLKGNSSYSYQVENGESVVITRPIEVQVVGREEPETLQHSSVTQEPSDSKFHQYQGRNFNEERIKYIIKVIDPSASQDIYLKNLLVDHLDLIPDPRDLFMGSAGLLLAVAQPLSVLDYLTSYVEDAAQGLGIGSEGISLIKDLYATEAEKFMQPENNPFTRAMESTAGRGIAGVMDGINFNWLSDFPWETDYNSRAPIGCQISFNFKVIHDIPPGLDHTGYNRAPLYNVGDIMKHASGDAYNDDRAAEFKYKVAGAGSTRD